MDKDSGGRNVLLALKLLLHVSSTSLKFQMEDDSSRGVVLTHQSDGSPAEGQWELREDVVAHSELLQFLEALEAVWQGADVVVGEV